MNANLNWMDRLGRKHEFFTYNDDEFRSLNVEHEGRTLRVLLPSNVPPLALKVVASTNEVVFVIGEEQAWENEDGTRIERGDGVLLVARKDRFENESYRVFVWHFLFPQALRCLESEKG